MKKHDLIDSLLGVGIISTLITGLGLILMMLVTSCGSTQMCSAYKNKPKVERTEQKSKASDPKPRISHGYVNCVGCK